jgi:hypothetical protein
MDHKPRIVAFGCLGLALLATAGVTHAERYSVPALDCVPATVSVVEYRNGNVFNVTNTFGNVECPLLRRAPDAADIVNIRVSVDDQNTRRGVACIAETCTLQGEFCSTDSTVESVGTGRQTLNLAPVPGTAGGYLYVWCEMPDEPGNVGQSAVLGITWED